MLNLFSRVRTLLQEAGDDLDLSVWWARISVLLGGTFVVLLACLGLWALRTIPRWQVNDVPSIVLRNDDIKRFELEDQARKTLSQIVLGAFGLIALFLTWRRVRAGDRNVRVIEQGHITDRYTKAIEQLGKVEGDKPNIEVRLGAIYALERIALDSARDHWTVMQVLTAYIRQNAPAPVGSAESVQEPRTDIQAILTVLKRRKRGKLREKDQTLDLGKTNLVGANLENAQLGRADLRRAYLQGALLPKAHLEGAYLAGAHLQGARLLGAHMKGADLNSAHLQRADLNGAHLEGAYLGRAHLRGARLLGAHMKGAYLVDAHLEEANLRDAHLEGANLTAAHLEGAKLFNAHLEGASLIDAHLREANFGDAHLKGADLGAAHLEGVTGLTVEQIRTAINWDEGNYDLELRQLVHAPQSDQTQQGN